MNQIIDATTSAQTFFQKVYGWMFGGLAISGITAYFVANSPARSNIILTNSGVFFIIIIAQLLLVIAIGVFIRKMSADIAIFLFLLYCLMTGVTLSSIFLVYSTASISTVFFITAGTFLVMSLYGMATKTDLSKVGQLLIMALFGIIIASVVNLFLQNAGIDYVVSIIGVIVFTGLTAYDTQKLKRLSTTVQPGGEDETKLSILGALNLYLDFINLFLELLRLFGKRR